MTLTAAADVNEVRVVMLYGSTAGLGQEIMVRRHALRSHESAPGRETAIGPTPYDLLVAAAGACKLK